MPTIQCQCNACDHPFSYLTFRGDVVAPACPRCRSTDIRCQPDDQGFMAESSMGAWIAGPPKGPS